MAEQIFNKCLSAEHETNMIELNGIDINNELTKLATRIIRIEDDLETNDDLKHNMGND